MIKVVLDTNILVSSLLSPGPPAAIVDLVANGRIIPFFNDLILREYRDVLSRKKFGFSSMQIIRLIENITKAGMAFEKIPSGKIKMIDEDDRVFHDTALGTNSYLVTGNIRHFPPRPFIVTPARFLTIYYKAKS